jgi:hypothetical protein
MITQSLDVIGLLSYLENQAILFKSLETFLQKVNLKSLKKTLIII